MMDMYRYEPVTIYDLRGWMGMGMSSSVLGRMGRMNASKQVRYHGTSLVLCA